MRRWWVKCVAVSRSVECPFPRVPRLLQSQWRVMVILRGGIRRDPPVLTRVIFPGHVQPISFWQESTGRKQVSLGVLMCSGVESGVEILKTPMVARSAYPHGIVKQGPNIIFLKGNRADRVFLRGPDNVSHVFWPLLLICSEIGLMGCAFGCLV